jgi:hypothetical protein
MEIIQHEWVIDKLVYVFVSDPVYYLVFIIRRMINNCGFRFFKDNFAC